MIVITYFLQRKYLLFLIHCNCMNTMKKRRTSQNYQPLIAIAKGEQRIFKFKQQSKVSDIAVVGLIQNCVLENLINLLLLFVQSEWTISHHEIINIHYPPLSKSILSQPFNEGLQFVSRLQVRRSLHFVFKYHEMFIGIQFFRDRQFWHCQSKRRLHYNENAKEHLLISLIDSLIRLRVGESLVIIGEIQWCVCDKTKLFILSISMILGRMLVLASHNRQSSHHNSINYLATLPHFLRELLLFCNLELIFLIFCSLKRLEDALLEAQFPILIHVLSIAVYYRIQTGFVDLEQEVSDSCWMDSVVAHYSLGEVAI